MSSSSQNLSSPDTNAPRHFGSTDHAIFVLAQIFRAYLAEASMEHLSTALKKANIKDLSLFFPPNKRDNKSLEEFFRKEQIPQVAEWWTKRQNALIKEEITKIVHDMLDHEDTPDNVRPIHFDPAFTGSVFIFFCWQVVVDSGLIR